MSDSIITVENLSKSYLIGHQAAQRNQYNTLRDVIVRESRNFARKASDLIQGRQIIQGDEVEEFSALRNLNFEVRRGEVLGIIGRNGAGKSTLLKILSRITEPTEGRVLLRGRVASLLEVGTGFHPELTGRENIFLNGAILGMTQREIRKKFDEIVAFAGVEKFLDTPVKRFSSGMYVRLAFAVAAHLDSDILIVDEVLAVGDQEFQQKCLSKMNNVASYEGRTVVLVSHNLEAIGDMATRALLLEGGQIAIDGKVAEAVSRYLSRDADAKYVRPPGPRPRTPCITKIDVRTSEPNAVHRFGEPLEVKIAVEYDMPFDKACLTLAVYNQHHHAMFSAFAHYPYFRFGNNPGQSLLVCKLPSLKLYKGSYYLRLYLSEPPGGSRFEFLDGVCPFEVVGSDRNSSYPDEAGSCAYIEDYQWELADTESA